VRNYGRLTERRALFVLPVHYETPVATLAAVPRAVREIIEATPEVRFERCHLLRCTETALEFEAVFFVTRPDYKAYADAQQSINLNILERFRTMEVSFIATAPKAVRLHPPLTPAADAGGQQRLL
jgi:small-conductance mechanosensitive channel